MSNSSKILKSLGSFALVLIFSLVALYSIINITKSVTDTKKELYSFSGTFIVIEMVLEGDILKFSLKDTEGKSYAFESDKGCSLKSNEIQSILNKKVSFEVKVSEHKNIFYSNLENKFISIFPIKNYFCNKSYKLAIR